MGTINEIEVSYRHEIPASLWKKIGSSADAAEVLYEHWDKGTIGLQESFKVVLLNNGNRVKGIYEISKGGITGTMVDLRILFAVILKSLTVGILLCHNHPSGTLKPSANDKSITKKIQNASKLFDIQVLDHIILAPDGSYYSFADDGCI
ncbi:JAB domain-containing protein [Flagellimonas meridianipacifica]|uniref:RadC-like JAB domain-containing protein n=1 Tax=Flagellimonas meridianipacifica TaxID=1080225 RepID=A0A2T0MF88_9FLAO|nr:JAB domain-containing protein [Allomuricauda pacifica]PRX56239.1 RadC-like JAB domain-containing protein [Allomuricauda pacifica]